MTPALQAAATDNNIIAACYFVIAALIFIGLVRERRLGFNSLATATCLIFFTCGLGHATHVEHYLEQASFYATMPDLWHQALTDGLTVIPAVIYLTLRRRYGLVIRGPHALLDFRRRLKIAETLRVIDRQSTRLGSLVSQLLDVSRLERDHLTIEPVETDLVGVVDGIVKMARLNAPDHEIVLTAPEPVVAVVDALRMEQVVQNLADNAIKFSPEGSLVDVCVRLTEPDLVELVMEDQGSGISAEHLPHIFEQAYQGGKVNRTAGLGLGLYISRQVVELHGGRIEAASPPRAVRA